MKFITLMMMITQVLSIPLYPYDDKGCCISCGYTYCDTLLECIRPWETDCPKLINPFLPQDNNIDN
jgi:hypothetical protein